MTPAPRVRPEGELAPIRAAGPLFHRIVTFRRLEVASFTHSVVYLGLLLCAFVLGGPQPETFILGLAHGVLWIVMSLVCIAAAVRRIIPFWLAVTVAVIGGLGPFAGSVGFVVAQRRRERSSARPEGEPRRARTSQ